MTDSDGDSFDHGLDAGAEGPFDGTGVHALDLNAVPGFDTLLFDSAAGTLIVSEIGDGMRLVAIEEDGGNGIDRAYLVSNAGDQAWEIDPASGTILEEVDPSLVPMPAVLSPPFNAPQVVDDQTGYVAVESTSPLDIQRPSADQTGHVTVESRPPLDGTAEQTGTITVESRSPLDGTAEQTGTITVESRSPLDGTAERTGYITFPESFVYPTDGSHAETITFPEPGSTSHPSVPSGNPALDTSTTILSNNAHAVATYWQQVTGTPVPEVDGVPRSPEWLLSTIKNAYVTDPAQQAQIDQMILQVRQIERNAAYLG